MTSHEFITLDGNSLTRKQLVAVARGGASVELDPNQLARVQRAADFLAEKVSCGEPTYGVTTGFGSNADKLLGAHRLRDELPGGNPHQPEGTLLDELQHNLIITHAVCVGKPFAEDVVRAMLVIRINTLMRGHSGIRVSTLQALTAMLNAGIVPVVPEKGSVGASGDLAPLSHLAIVLLGGGEAFYRGERMPGAEALKREVELIKSLGFNAVRIHQKIEDPRFLYWADHLGLMVWGEIANAYEYNAQAVDRLTREWLSAVKRDRSHPCIVTWVPINESWGVSDIAIRRDQQDFATSLYYLTKAIDQTRPVISNEGWEHTISDIWGFHDYTQFKAHLAERYGTREAIERTLTEMRPTRKRLLLRPEDRRGQPVMLTEFGGLSMHPKSGEAWFGYATAQSDEEYLAMIKQLFDGIYESTDLAGFCYTQLTDTLQETNGLYDENRQPKLPIERLRDIIMRPSNAVPSESLDIARQRALRVTYGQVVV